MKVRVTKKVASDVKVPITTEYIKLESLLKLANCVGSGGMAKTLILAEEVQVNGEVCTMRGKKLRSGDRVEFAGNTYVVESSFTGEPAADEA